MKFVDPKSDIAFKKIFGDAGKSEILISFLNAVLELSSPIVSVTIVSPYQVPRIKDLKDTSLDVKAIDANGREFIVEMQMEGNELFGKRSLYYLAKSYVGQIKKAEDYQKLKPVYFIGILNFNMLEGENFLTRHIIINQDSGRQDLKDFEFNFLELPKFTTASDELTTIVEKWAFFLKNAENLDVIPPAFTEPELLEAFDTANQMKWSREELDVYDYWSIKEGDRICQIKTAEKKGREEGREEGRKQEQLKIALNLLDVLDSETIAMKTGLSVDEINQLRN